jgi:long-chain acyl-CoA synthetase
MRHPAVSLVAVVGVPNPAHGEEIKAYVIRAEGASLTADDLIDWAREQMAAYKHPRLVQFVDSLPMTSTGKILKRELTRIHAGTQPADPHADQSVAST